jgi:hypothetical protein
MCSHVAKESFHLDQVLQEGMPDVVAVVVVGDLVQGLDGFSNRSEGDRLKTLKNMTCYNSFSSGINNTWYSMAPELHFSLCVHSFVHVQTCSFSLIFCTVLFSLHSV